MSEIGTRSLNWDVIVAPAIPVVTDDLPPGIQQRILGRTAERPNRLAQWLQPWVK
jgi:hypothetical protein